MDNFDQQNLEFLINTSDEDLEDFFNEIDDDDLEYAIELLRSHMNQIILKILALQDEVDGVEEADKVISNLIWKSKNEKLS